MITNNGGSSVPSNQDIHNRIDRMEAKLDKLVDAVTELVKVDIQLQNISERLNTHSDNLKMIGDRVDRIEGKIPVYDIVVNWGGKVAMLVSGSIVLGVISSYFVFKK